MQSTTALVNHDRTGPQRLRPAHNDALHLTVGFAARR